MHSSPNPSPNPPSCCLSFSNNPLQASQCAVLDQLSISKPKHEPETHCTRPHCPLPLPPPLKRAPSPSLFLTSPSTAMSSFLLLHPSPSHTMPSKLFAICSTRVNDTDVSVRVRVKVRFCSHQLYYSYQPRPSPSPPGFSTLTSIHSALIMAIYPQCILLSSRQSTSTMHSALITAIYLHNALCSHHGNLPNPNPKQGHMERSAGGSDLSRGIHQPQSPRRPGHAGGGAD